MHIHILGICGTFMGGIALLARALGHEVTGSDANVYPPMSTQLEREGIALTSGYDPAALEPAPDLVIIGNALSRGNPAVEYVLDRGLRYCSGPAWLSEQVLFGRHVMAVSGTHGKTTTTSMLAWVLEAAGLNPGFLIGGVAENFACSARLTQGRHFVVEADEYDTAFFDKRSKFIHYQPRTLIINNIEYDHADIFADISEIIREFRRLVRIVPGTGLIIHPQDDPNIPPVMAAGCWTPRTTLGTAGADWCVIPCSEDYSVFDVQHQGQTTRVEWSLIGEHNARNALAVMAAASHVGVSPASCATALRDFRSVKRRLQRLATIDGVTVFDDFAHHPTAIRTTLSALRAQAGDARIIAVFEPRSNTMKLGVHRETLAPALAVADLVVVLRPSGLDWDMAEAMIPLGERCRVMDSVPDIIDLLVTVSHSGDQIIIMSNGSFEGLHQRLLDRLHQQSADGDGAGP